MSVNNMVSSNMVFTMSLLNINQKKKKEQKHDGIVLFCFGEDKLDVALCVKASEFMHTRKHTHSFLSREWILSPFWGG